MAMPDRNVTIYRNVFQQFEWREFACGWLSAVANITITYPIYKVIFRQVGDTIILILLF